MRQLLFLLAAVGLGMLFLPDASAQQRSQPQEVLKILGISIEGNTLADPAAIIANSGLKIGDQITVPGDQISQAIKKLWSLKIFDDVQIAIDRRVGEGVYLVINVRELPRYDRIEFKGRDELSEDDIMKKLNLVRGQVLAANELTVIKREILKLYAKDGYFLAKVNVTTAPADTGSNRVVVHVDIDEGPEVQVDNITFRGNKAFSDGDLRGAMDNTSEKHWWKFWSSAKFDAKKYQEDKNLIVQFYRKNGYRDAEVLGDSIWYTDNKRDMDIQITVREGSLYHFRHVSWSGNTVYPDELLNDRLGIRPGEVYNSEKLEKNLRGNDAQTDVAALYLDNGYLRFNLEPVETRVPGDSVDLQINVYEMNQFKIGHIGIKGNTKTQEKVIRRELMTRPGDYFSRAAIMRSLRQLQQLNYFNPEKLKPDYQMVDDKTVDLTYEVEEKSSDNINASVGYSGAFGVTGALGFTINNFSISEPLTGGAGQILNFQWEFGEASRFRTFSIGFTEPWLFNTPTLFGVSLFDTRQIYTFDLQQTGGSIRVGRRFRWPDDYFRGDWILNGQRNDVRNGLGYYQEGVTSQVALTQIISRNSTDNPIFPTMGSNNSLSFEISGGPFLPGNVKFTKWTLQSDWYVPLFNSSRLALYFSSLYGVIDPIGGGTGNISPIDLFSMGGTGLGYINTTPLRGYEDQSIGPRVNGSVVAGRAETKQTLELRFAVSINPIPIYLLSFAEGGNVFETSAKTNFFDLKRSAGVGARIQINPIGLIGFDYGYGFDDVAPKDGKPDGWHFHFVFGRGF
ncbi:MAG TPA: outer membrane protein assembly factor BamA [Bacteroidota bacterium]